MKKLILIGLVLLLWVSFAWAVPPTMITNPDGSTVYSEGTSLKTSDKARAIKTGYGQVYTGACRLLGVNLYSDTAGDLVGIYDTSAAWVADDNSRDYTHCVYDARDIEFELAISVNTSSNYLDAKGVPFVHGIGILATDETNSVITTMFDY